MDGLTGNGRESRKTEEPAETEAETGVQDERHFVRTKFGPSWLEDALTWLTPRGDEKHLGMIADRLARPSIGRLTVGSGFPTAQNSHVAPARSHC